jgi:cysteinyl-tRNA synthetase
MRLSDTLTRKITDLPEPPADIGIYVCGPTVYQRIHIGNARPFVIFSWLRDYLRSRGYSVRHVSNITDVNDKIYEAAPGRSAELAEQASGWYVEDTSRLGLGRPDHEPKATETVPEIIALTEELIAGGHAYEAGGDVYFRVRSFPAYGQLSNQRPDQVEEQEPNPLKEDPRDFAVWKATKPGEDTSWPSPWGDGRPAWHIECSAMAEKFLGPSFEIHGAGLDLVFPHNENEIAQSQSVGHGFARIWMHNGMLELTGEKMSKSLGNIATLQAVLEEWGRETVLLYFMTAHWRKPIDFSEDALWAAKAQAQSFRNHFVGLADPGEAPDAEWYRLEAVLDDDFNTPDALALFHDWRARGESAALLRGLRLFGLGSLADQVAAPADVVALAEQRQAARAAGNFAEADRLRAGIEAAGWDVRDVAEPPGFQLVPRPR